MSKNVLQKIKRFRKFYPSQYRFIFTQKNMPVFFNFVKECDSTGKKNRQSLKIMVSAGVSWNGVTKPFFINLQIAKVTGSYYINHLKRQMLPACRRLYPNNDYYYVQNGASSLTSHI